jgi:O-antigen ligase
MTGIAVGSALSLWSGSRAGVIATLVSAVVALALAERGQRIRAFIRMATGFLAGVLLSLIWIPPHSMWGIPRILGVVQKGGATIGEVASNRDLLWLEAIRLFRDQPLIGYGEGQFRFLNRAGWPANHPHDVVLQFLVQWGLVGTLAMIVVAWHAIPHSIRRWEKPLPRSLPALCALVAVGTEGIVDGPLFYAFPTLAVGILLVVLGNSDAGPRPKTPGVRP